MTRVDQRPVDHAACSRVARPGFAAYSTTTRLPGSRDGSRPAGPRELHARRTASALALVILLQGATAAAQPIPAHPSELTYELLDFTPPVSADHRHELSNGVVVFVVEDHELPLATGG